MIGAWFSYYSPILVAAIAGLLYGYSFLLQHHSWMRGGYTLRGRVISVSFFVARFTILLGAIKYLLRSALIPSILGVVLFIAIFWLVIMRVKVTNHERHWDTRE